MERWKARALGLATAGLLTTLTATGAWAVSITYDSVPDANGVPTTQVAGATVWNFDDGVVPWATASTDDGSALQDNIVQGSLSGQYAAPFIAATSTFDPTRYLSAPEPGDANHSGWIQVNLGAAYTYFGLLWGSIDAYNTIAFYDGSTQVAAFTGTDVTNPNTANGNQTAPSTNTYVNFFDLPSFDGFRLSSSQFAFEADNIAVAPAPVPEPTTMLLLGSGLIALAGCGRRRRK